jgi:excisionase family DNA binding protein
MAGKLLELKEAAILLGVSPEELAEMRARGEIHGYRDGVAWKFKRDDVERLATERGGGGGSKVGKGSAAFDSDLEQMFDVDAGEGDDLDPSSVLVSDQSLGKSPEGTSSTVIGKGGAKEPAKPDSDIQVSASPANKDKSGSGKGSDVELVAGEGAGSDVQLVAGGSDVFSTGSKKAGGGSKSGSDKGKAAPKKPVADDLDPHSINIQSDDLGLGEDLSLGDEIGLSGSDAKKKEGSGIDLDVGDDDLVLGTGSDVTKGAGDSGIGLANPADSGLSLEEPLELTGSGAESLELGEDDMISLSDEPADPDVATQLKPDNEFLLTPVEDTSGEEADSGSQVIALDTDEFSPDANTMLATGAAAPMLEAEPAMMGAPVDLGPGSPMPSTSPLMVSMQAPEIPYSVWNVLSLAVVVLMLGVTGIMMADLLRYMWSWDQTVMTPSPLMDGILEIFKSNP